MDRADIMAAMGELKLYGMRAAYDELMAVAVGWLRCREPYCIA